MADLSNLSQKEEVRSKYTVLPFIDSSGKDVFESGNDYQSPGENQLDTPASDEIESTTLDQQKSFNVFKNKYVDSSGLDFSDKIHATHKSGYETKTVYEIISEQVAKETPQQKYQRLQHELRELSEDVTQIKESMESAEKEASSVHLAKDVQVLEKQLHDLHLEKVLGSNVVATDGVQPGTWSKQVSQHLETFKARPASKEGSTDDSVVYEMYYKPEHSRFAHAAKISELEAKLKDMEKLIGNDPTRLSTLIADPQATSSSLVDATASLQAKLSLMDISHIDLVAARLQGLLNCINEVAQKKDAIENIDRQKKITELHELVSKFDSSVDIIPDLVERLKALRGLNEQASSFSQSLEHLTTSQNEVRDQLRVQKDMLQKFESSFDGNMKSIQANCTSLEGRISELMKKVGNL